MMNPVGLAGCAEFTRRLLQVPSLPGEEGELAGLVHRELEHLGFDQVRSDDAGNVIGLCRGLGLAPATMFNTHLDHVSPGDPEAWPHPPYGGVEAEGRLVGRGAVDIKGPLAAQVYAVGRILSSGSRPPGDVYVTAVVMEEVGGLGAVHLCEQEHFPFVIVGEPSSNQLRRGHRGRAEIGFRALGRSCHASVPQRGINALEVAARFIARLGEVEHGHHPELGASSAAATRISTDQSSPNVIPGEALVTCDWRTVPGEKIEHVLEKLRRLAVSCSIEGSRVAVDVVTEEKVTYTGFRRTLRLSHPAYLLAPDHPAVRTAGDVLCNALRRSESPGIWKFATDGGHFGEAGMTVLGFGPGEETAAHTVGESIALSDLEEALIGNEALARYLARSCGPV